MSETLFETRKYEVRAYTISGARELLQLDLTLKPRRAIEESDVEELERMIKNFGKYEKAIGTVSQFVKDVGLIREEV